jgi:hypothetical protein
LAQNSQKTLNLIISSYYRLFWLFAEGGCLNFWLFAEGVSLNFWLFAEGVCKKSVSETDKKFIWIFEKTWKD